MFRIRAPDGRTVVVKEVAREAAAAGRSLRGELFAYRLANWISAVAAALPHPLLIDEKHQVLVVESLGNSSIWPTIDGSSSIGSPGIAEQLGAIMAGWHDATQDTGLWASPAIGILHMPDALDAATAGRAGTTQILMRSMVDDPELSSALRAARAGWRDRCLIHGDIRRENWITVVPGRVTGLKVLDWELSGSGDPAWDLGSVLAEFALESIRGQRDDASHWHLKQQAAIREFFQAYATHGGLLNTGESSEWSHVVLCAVARLLHVACEWAELQSSVETGPVPAVVAEARFLLHHRSELVEQLMRHSTA